MATAGRDNDSAVYYECPVCRECLKDPRKLDCGHYFCCECIEGVIRETPKSPTKCPTCRKVTQRPERGVTELPPYNSKYSFHDHISDYLSRAKRQVSRSCDICREKEINATCHCYRCRKNLCDDYLKKHEKRLPTHRCMPLSENIFCPSHVNEVVIEYCMDCKRGICVECVF